VARRAALDAMCPSSRVSILDFDLDAICAASLRAIEMHRSNTLSFTRRRAP